MKLLCIKETKFADPGASLQEFEENNWYYHGLFIPYQPEDEIEIKEKEELCV